MPHLWPTAAPYKFIDCAGDCFIIKFGNQQDYQMALLNGPWVVYGHYLTVQPWTPEFSPLDHSVTHVVGWVRLPMLPVKYYQNSVVRAIEQMLGSVIRIDYNTEVGERGRFARLAVVIDLSKPLISKVNVDGRTLFIEYEGLPSIYAINAEYMGIWRKIVLRRKTQRHQHHRLMLHWELHKEI